MKLPLYVIIIIFSTLIACNPKIENNGLNPTIGVAVKIAEKDVKTIISAGVPGTTSAPTTTENLSLTVNQGDEILIIASGNDTDGIAYTKIEVIGANFLKPTPDAQKLTSKIRTDASEGERKASIMAKAYLVPKGFVETVVIRFETKDLNNNISVSPTLSIHFLPQPKEKDCEKCWKVHEKLIKTTTNFAALAATRENGKAGGATEAYWKAKAKSNFKKLKECCLADEMEKRCRQLEKAYAQTLCLDVL